KSRHFRASLPVVLRSIVLERPPSSLPPELRVSCPVPGLRRRTSRRKGQIRLPGAPLRSLRPEASYRAGRRCVTRRSKNSRVDTARGSGRRRELWMRSGPSELQSSSQFSLPRGETVSIPRQLAGGPHQAGSLAVEDWVMLDRLWPRPVGPFGAEGQHGAFSF